MAANPKYNLIIVKGEDKTTDIESWKFDVYKPVIYIEYKNGRVYPYNTADVIFLKNPKNIKTVDSLVYCCGQLKFGVLYIQYFYDFARIVYKNNYTEIYDSCDIHIVNSALNDVKSKACFDYLKDIAIVTGITVDGSNILAKRYEKIDFIRDDTVAAAFLSGNLNDNFIEQKNKNIVYPFSFNISQKRAVENALVYKVSVIEGPPGTGKTQTILNIIANAVMRGESVAVVSNNNSATENIYQKLKKYGLEFIAAILGNSNNKESFIKNQSNSLPDIVYKKEKVDYRRMFELFSELNDKMEEKNELSELIIEEDSLKKEKEHFDSIYRFSDEKMFLSFYRKATAEKILAFTNEYEYAVEQNKKIGVLKKFIFKFSYGLKKFDNNKNLLNYSKKLFYEKRLDEIKRKKSLLEKSLKDYDFDSKIKQYAELSMALFKNSLARRYEKTKRKTYAIEDLKRDSESFIFDYPVILSTTHSLCSSLSDRVVYDYVIVDESSQVDLATGALSLTCAKKAVIVGDLKQLPNVVDSEQKQKTDDIFLAYNLPPAYKYSNHSLLSSVTELFPKIPKVLLREHYRCNPEIIGFCNQKFYNGELLIMTPFKSNEKAMTVYRTVAGNMARNRINERQIDVIRNEVIPEQKINLSDGSVGIVTPYRNQANRLKEIFADTAVQADTVDKFQGQERNIMIFSTVDNEIGDFAADPNRLNVAVSRAKDKFIVVTDGNNNDKSSAIHDLIEYIKYHNNEIIDSKINSVFDYLYEKNKGVRELILKKYGRISEYDSENLMYVLIKDVLKSDKYISFGVVSHIPLNLLLRDLSLLSGRELEFASNCLSHVDFLIYSKVTHLPIMAIEVDGFAYHNTEKQRERDLIKNSILQKYEIPLLRLSTVGSGEREKINAMLSELTKT